MHPGDALCLPGPCLSCLATLEPLGLPLVPLETDEVGRGGVGLDDPLILASLSFLSAA